mmetsp:Transcript_26723/g.78711  ORF Transcript_26723/g.78711 Transcript_26723/m.78711 type:complete len:213 (+) Transcript_26723:220-858(+)
MTYAGLVSRFNLQPQACADCGSRAAAARSRRAAGGLERRRCGSRGRLGCRSVRQSGEQPRGSVSATSLPTCDENFAHCAVLILLRRWQLAIGIATRQCAGVRVRPEAPYDDLGGTWVVLGFAVLWIKNGRAELPDEEGVGAVALLIESVVACPELHLVGDVVLAIGDLAPAVHAAAVPGEVAPVAVAHKLVAHHEALELAGGVELAEARAQV